MIAEERIYLDKTGKKVVKHNHPDCSSLLCAVGKVIPKEFQSQCKDGKVPGKSIPNAPKDLPAITPAKIESQIKASAKHTNTQPMKDNGSGESKKKSGLQINAKKEKE